MNEDRVIGNAKNVGGRVEEGLGQATGDVKSQLQGKAKQVEGAAQDVYGQVKETASDAVDLVFSGLCIPALGVGIFLSPTRLMQEPAQRGAAG